MGYWQHTKTTKYRLKALRPIIVLNGPAQSMPTVWKTGSLWLAGCVLQSGKGAICCEAVFKLCKRQGMHAFSVAFAIGVPPRIQYLVLSSAIICFGPPICFNTLACVCSMIFFAKKQFFGIRIGHL